jgi:hypothetical protein
MRGARAPVRPWARGLHPPAPPWDICEQKKTGAAARQRSLANQWVAGKGVKGATSDQPVLR